VPLHHPAWHAPSTTLVLTHIFSAETHFVNIQHFSSLGASIIVAP